MDIEQISYCFFHLPSSFFPQPSALIPQPSFDGKNHKADQIAPVFSRLKVKC